MVIYTDYLKGDEITYTCGPGSGTRWVGKNKDRRERTGSASHPVLQEECASALPLDTCAWERDSLPDITPRTPEKQGAFWCHLVDK